MPKPMRGETPPRTQFWTKHPFERDVWRADFPGSWVLRKAAADLGNPAGWWLIGTDPDDSTHAVWLGQRIGRAKQWGEKYITRPWLRDRIREEVRS